MGGDQQCFLKDKLGMSGERAAAQKNVLGEDPEEREPDLFSNASL